MARSGGKINLTVVAGLACTLVFFGLERTGLLMDIDRREVRQAVRLFKRCFTQHAQEQKPHKGQAAKLDMSDIRRLLSRPEYEDTWLFDLTDLSNFGITLKDEPDSGEDWIRECAAQIGGTELSNRVLAMAEHMAKWHSWKGEDDASELLMALADDVAERHENSILLHVMLERLADWMHAE